MKGEIPQYKGFIEIQGLKIEISAWLNEDKNGNTFISAPLGKLGSLMLFKNVPKEKPIKKELRL